jgi:glucan phosphoethanolaminetransferase (alkaline phosphatase superfamily)
MTVPVLHILRQKDFELQIWCVTMAIAAARTLKAVVQDLTGAIYPSVLAIDVLILCTFCVLGLLIYHNKITRIPLAAGPILLGLLIFSYVQFDGIFGTTEYNLMGLGVLFVLVYDYQTLRWLMVLYLLAILGANYYVRIEGPFEPAPAGSASGTLDNFFTTLVAGLILILYFKDALVRESGRILKLRKELGRKVDIITLQHQELERRKRQLHEANANLQAQIQEHTQQIVRQNKAIEDYMRLSSESLSEPLRNIIAETVGLRDDSFLERQLKQEVSELHIIVRNLREDIKRHGDFK